MTELRHSETNAADDSAGRAFGLEGNLYLPVLLSVLGSLALFAVLRLNTRRLPPSFTTRRCHRSTWLVV